MIFKCSLSHFTAVLLFMLIASFNITASADYFIVDGLVYYPFWNSDNVEVGAPADSTSGDIVIPSSLSVACFRDKSPRWYSTDTTGSLTAVWQVNIKRNHPIAGMDTLYIRKV